VLMVAAVVWQVIIPRVKTEVQSAGATRAASAPGRADASAWLTRTLPAGDGTLPDARRKPAPQDAPDYASGAVASAVPAWRVVLYSYEHQSDAERRVELVNHNHPGLRAHLFVAGNGGPYVVVTGDATTQEHAQALRKRALQLGLPHAHVQEFTQ
jgi:eukaryotic-like serine/threonine-protein kinase